MLDKMDEDKKAKMVEKLKDLGIAEDTIDEDLIWTVKKLYHKVNKLRLILDEKGVEESKAKEIIDKLTAKATEKDLSKIKEWHEEHKHEHN